MNKGPPELYPRAQLVLLLLLLLLALLYFVYLAYGPF